MANFIAEKFATENVRAVWRQWSFCVSARPMREDVTIQLRLSLAKHMHRKIRGEGGDNHDFDSNIWNVKIEIVLKTCPLKYDVHAVVKFNFE